MDKTSKVFDVVLKAVTGIAGIFTDRSIYSQAVEAAKSYCKGNPARWKTLAVEVRRLWKEENPDPKAKKLAGFNQALSYFRKQVGIRPLETGGGSPVLKATVAAEKAQAAIDEKEEAKPTTQNQRVQLAKMYLTKLAEICGCEVGDAFELIKIAVKESK